MQWEEIIPIVSAGLPFLIAFITFLTKFIKSNKAKKVLQGTVKVTEILQQLIVSAEKFTDYTGAEKKEYVLTKVNRFLIENKMKFDQEQISQLIDELVNTTKKVNRRPKDLADEEQEFNRKETQGVVSAQNKVTQRTI